MVFHTNPCNFEIFKTVVKYFLKHYRAQISLLFITGQAIWALKCVKERFNDSLKILAFARICIENHARVASMFRRQLHQSLLLRNFNMLFQFALTKVFKSELFSCLPEVDHVITVMRKAYSLYLTEFSSRVERWVRSAILEILCISISSFHIVRLSPLSRFCGDECGLILSNSGW